MIKTIILVLSLIANVIAAIFLLPHLSDRIVGHRYDLSKREDVTTLRRLIYQSEPLRLALECYREAHSAFPDDLGKLSFSFPNYKTEVIDSDARINALVYVLDGKGYRLYVKLNWDASLDYESIQKEWRYDPGDGSDVISLTP